MYTPPSNAASPHAGARLVDEERGNAIDDIGAVEPGPVTRVREMEELRLAPEGAGIRVGEARGNVSVAVSPYDQCGTRNRPEIEPGARERVLGTGPVEPQDRPLGPLVEVGPGVLGERRRHHALEGLAAGEAHGRLADAGGPPRPGDAMPAVAGQQRDRVDHHEALHALGEALGPQ